MDLSELEKIQQECAKKVSQKDEFSQINTVGGIDLTFENIKENPTRAWASLVVVDVHTKKPIYSHVTEGVVDFPYIPTFLAFRELPLMLKVYQEAKIKPDAFMIDGQGISHPRGCGIASHFGVTTNTVSVGVAKTLLVGKYESLGRKRGSLSPIVYKGKVVGVALRTKDNTEPVYVSVGHKISLRSAVGLVLSLCLYRIPEPTRLAHNLLQKVRKDASGK